MHIFLDSIKIILFWSLNLRNLCNIAIPTLFVVLSLISVKICGVFWQVEVVDPVVEGAKKVFIIIAKQIGLVCQF
jgi:hypothetical protein